MGVVTAVKMGPIKKNQFAPSNISVQLAIASSKKQLTIDLGTKNHIMLFSIKGDSPAYTPKFEQTLEDWKKAITESSKGRNTWYIATGNLLQFFGKDELPRAKLVQFSTDDGKSEKELCYQNPTRRKALVRIASKRLLCLSISVSFLQKIISTF